MNNFAKGPWNGEDGDEAYRIYDKYGQSVFHILYPFGVIDLQLILKTPEMYDMINELESILITVYNPVIKESARFIDLALEKIRKLKKGLGY